MRYTFSLLTIQFEKNIFFDITFFSVTPITGKPEKSLFGLTRYKNRISNSWIIELAGYEFYY